MQVAYRAAAEQDRPSWLQLVPPWVAGIAVILLVTTAGVMAVWEWGARGDPRSLDGTILPLLMGHGTALAGFAAGTWVATTLHGEPSRLVRWRHWLASFGPAITMQGLSFAGPGMPTFAGGCLQLGVLLTGCTLGFVATRLPLGP